VLPAAAASQNSYYLPRFDAETYLFQYYLFPISERDIVNAKRVLDIGEVEGNPRHTDSSYPAENTLQAATHSIGPERRLNTGHYIRPNEYKSAKTAVHRGINFDWKERENL